MGGSLALFLLFDERRERKHCDDGKRYNATPNRIGMRYGSFKKNILSVSFIIAISRCNKMVRQRDTRTLLWKRMRRRAQLACLVLGISLSSYRHALALSFGSPKDHSVAKAKANAWQFHAWNGISVQLAATTPSQDGSSLMQVDDDAMSFRRSGQPSAAEMQEIRRQVGGFLRQQDFEGARELILGMMEVLDDESTVQGGEDRTEVSTAIDQAFQTYYTSAFVPPYRGSASKSRISLGVDLLQTQISSSLLAPPYNEVPKPVLLSALKALTGLNEVTPMKTWSGRLDNADAAYRILQRLVTGVGVRHMLKNHDNNNENKAGSSKVRLYEKDFNLVLHAYTNVGRMDMAHRIVALQERTANAPVLSPVAFSILLKGYGKLGDLHNVNMLLGHAEASGVVSDVIMMNSLIDAYINCGAFDQAQEVFEFMKHPTTENALSLDYPILFDSSRCPIPNKRTYNTVLKGLASRGMFIEAQRLAEDMERRDVWDHVTTNTLVQAAVKAYDFDATEEILKRYTATSLKKNGSHPNAEAYTTAIDGFAKRGDMTKALELLKKMKLRGVEPNEFTYTCLVGALAKNKKVDQAKKMLSYMKSLGLRPRVVTYNALISGLVHHESALQDHFYDRHVDEAITLLKDMMKEGIRPNTVTISVLVAAFGKCQSPRVAEALSLVEKLEEDGIISNGNGRISTALAQVLGAAGDFDGAMARFRTIRKPDVPAINALLDICVRCDKDQAATKTFEHFFQGPKSKARPDVISYSTLITSVLKKVSYDGSKEARRLYEEMKFRRRILPDNALVDIILKAMIENGRNGSLRASDVRFVAAVLRDAEKLEWSEGQLESRKRAVQTIMTGRFADTWEEESDLYGLTSVDEYEDELFKKHGWNRVDSGFRLWGASLMRDNRRQRGSDDFLQSKGWNNVDSGFRII